VTDDHSHDGHTHGAASSYGTVLYLSLIATVIFVVAEAGIGYVAHSLALMSDAGHNFCDALSLALSAYAIRIARKPANSRNTFGYHRVAILTALLNSAALAVISIGILVKAVQTFADPVPIDSRLMLITAAVALVVNGAIVLALHGGAKHSLNIRATYLHMAADVISSILVLLAAIVIAHTRLYILDPVVSLGIAAIIFTSCWKIVREATDILLESSPRGLDIELMIDRVLTLPHVNAVHDLHVWTVSDGLDFLSCHIEVADTHTMAECADIMRSINTILLNDFGIAHSTIQVEIAGTCISSDDTDPLYCGGTNPRTRRRGAAA
jgi:cobalt-zinc-cadmium efflux system protein